MARYVLEAAAVRVTTAGDSTANAHVRLAWEANVAKIEGFGGAASTGGMGSEVLGLHPSDDVGPVRVALAIRRPRPAALVATCGEPVAPREGTRRVRKHDHAQNRLGLSGTCEPRALQQKRARERTPLPFVPVVGLPS